MVTDGSTYPVHHLPSHMTGQARTARVMATGQVTGKCNHSNGAQDCLRSTIEHDPKTRYHSGVSGIMPGWVRTQPQQLLPSSLRKRPR